MRWRIPAVPGRLVLLVCVSTIVVAHTLLALSAHQRLLTS